MISEDFMFGDSWLSEWSMKMYDPENSQSFVSRSIDKSEITSLRAKPNHFGTTYSDALVLDFLIIKDEDECETWEDFKLTGDDIHYLRGWLESPKKPTELVVPLKQDDMTAHYFGVFTNVQPFNHRGDCFGLYLQFTCNAPYAYSDERKSVFKVTDGSAAVNGRVINLSSEHQEYLKPKVIITSSSTFGSDESLEIKNTSDNNSIMAITLPEGKSQITIDCEQKIVTDQNGKLVSLGDIGVVPSEADNYNFISTDMVLFYWLSFVPNENNLVFTPSDGNTIEDIQIRYRDILKAGGF